MAIKSYFINSTQADYEDEEFAWFQSLLLTSGILGEPDTGNLEGYLVHENTTANMGVLIDTGKALLEVQIDDRTFKVVFENLEQTTLTLDNNNGAAENRVDSIIININPTVDPDVTKTNVAQLEIVKGTSATALTDSEITTEVGDEFWYRLADITVQPDTTQILNDDITDQREKIKFTEAWEREYDPISTEGDLVRGSSSGGSERLPIGDEGKALVSSGGLPSWQVQSATNIEEFSSSGTWTKPEGLKMVVVEIWGAGGSGGAANGWDDTYGHEFTGNGGGGGEYLSVPILASNLNSTETVTIGSGGSPVSADAQTNGNNVNGNDGGNSSFAGFTAHGGGGGTSTQHSGTADGGEAGSPIGFSGHPLYGETFHIKDLYGSSSRHNGMFSGMGAGYLTYTSDENNFGEGIKSGGDSIYGGAGGGCENGSGSTGGRGTSQLGGDGGAGGGGNGSPKGGGGGGAAGESQSTTFTSGAGGDGFVRIKELF